MEKGASPWSVQNGGTRRDSLTAHGVLIGQGSAPVNFVVLNAGQILVGQNEADPQGKTVSGDATIDASGVVKLFPLAPRGSILYRGAAGWAAATPGTAGQIWTSNGADADPTYQDATGGGGGLSDTDRRNVLLDRIYASKALASPQRRINSYSLGFKSSGGIDDGSSSNYTVDTTNGLLKPTISPASYSNVLDTTLNGNVSAAISLWRQQFAAATLADVSGSKIRISITSPSTGANSVLSEVFIGHAGTAPNFDGNQVRVTFNGGSNGVTLTAGGATVVSDPVTFTYDHTKDLIVAFERTSGDLRRNNTTAGSNYTIWSKTSGTGESGTTTVTGYSTATSALYLVDLIQVQTAPATTDNMTAVTANQTADNTITRDVSRSNTTRWIRLR
jgi:hypothetical protein